MAGVVTTWRKGAALALLVSAALLVQGVAAEPAAAASARRGRMLSLTNADRIERDRGRLQLDDELSKYARRHSRRMARKGYLFHTEDLAAVLEGVEWSIAGENVGVGSDLETLQKAFMRSKPHRRNILRKAFENAAIGIVADDDGERYWVTVIFYG